MIVTDTNLIGYLFLTSAHSMLAERVFQKDPVWAAPLLWRSELRNVLALYDATSAEAATGVLRKWQLNPDYLKAIRDLKAKTGAHASRAIPDVSTSSSRGAA